MARDISTIPDRELAEDRLDSLADIRLCNLALQQGTTHYSGGSVQERLDANRGFVRVIEAEQARRRTVAAP